MTVISSGEHFELITDQHRVPLVKVGGGLRGHTCDDTAVLDGDPRHDRCTGARDSPLIPWPNRLADDAPGVTGLAAALSPGRRR
jgi:hypothetical protein